MRKIVRCRDLGMDCDFEVRAETVQEILQKSIEHAMNDHGMEDVPADLIAKVTAAIQGAEQTLEVGLRSSLKLSASRGFANAKATRPRPRRVG